MFSCTIYSYTSLLTSQRQQTNVKLVNRLRRGISCLKKIHKPQYSGKCIHIGGRPLLCRCQSWRAAPFSWKGGICQLRGFVLWMSLEWQIPSHKKANTSNGIQVSNRRSWT